MEKVEEIDFNGNSVPAETGQPEKTEVEEKVETEPVKTEEVKTEEDIESLPQWAKDRLTKVEEEKENYKKGMFKYKDLTLEKKKEEVKEEEEEYPEWDENSQKFQKQTISLAEKTAERIAQQKLEKSNENEAIRQFVNKHPEIADNWNDIVANYHPANGKDTIQGVLKDLNRALVLTRYEKGDLDKIEVEALKKGEVKGRAESKLADMASVSKTTQKTVNQGNALSPAALRMAERMKVSPEKLALEDDSLTAEIKY